MHKILLSIFLSTLFVNCSVAQENKDQLVTETVNIPVTLSSSYSTDSYQFVQPKYCEVCKKEHKKSLTYKTKQEKIVKQNIFFDKKIQHNHSVEIAKTPTYCQNGHWWFETTRTGKCPCGWDVNKKEEAAPTIETAEDKTLNDEQLFQVKLALIENKNIDKETILSLIKQLEELKNR